jgi:hypothetical protein
MRTSPQPDRGAGRPASLRRLWPIALGLFLLTFTVFGFTARHGGGSWDYYTANYASWNLVHSGAPWLHGTVPGLQGDPEAGTWIQVAENGHTVVRRFPGVIAIALPAYWLADAKSMTVVPGALTAALACASGVLMLFLALRTRVSQSYAGGAALALAFTTPVWTIAADAVWPHTVTMLGIAGMAWGAAKNRWWLVGLFGGVTLWGRLHAAVVVAVFGLLLGWWRRSPRITVVIGAVSAAMLGLVCWWTHWWTGSWNPISSYGSEDVLGYIPRGADHVREELAMWVAPDRGILVWTPVVLILTPALFRAWRGLPDWSRGLLLGGLAYTLLQGWMRNGIGGDSFYGYRLGIEFVVAATPAYALAAAHAGRVARAWLAPLLALQFTACLFGSVEDVFLPKTQAWVDNAFAYAMRDSWPAGPLMMLLVFLGAWAVIRRATAALPEAAPSGPHGDDSARSQLRGTVSSHSVP